jgi:hypothetical protein
MQDRPVERIFLKNTQHENEEFQLINFADDVTLD